MGKITRRHFPLVSRASMQSQNQLACKYSFPFTLGDEVGALSLLPGHLSSPIALTHWSCALGNFSLGDGIPLLNMLSLSPFTDQDVQSPACEWELILFNQYLSPELANLFGEIKRCDRAEKDVLSTRLIVRLESVVWKADFISAIRAWHTGSGNPVGNLNDIRCQTR